jgi:PAS domain S-box-containing protein
MDSLLNSIDRINEESVDHSTLLNEDHYKTIFNNSAIAITVTDASENIVIWNKFAEILLEMDYNDLFRKPVKQLYPEQEWQRIRSENIRQKGMHHHMETRVITKKGEIIEVDLSISVLNDSQGKVRGSIGIIRDISETKRNERALQESMELSRGMIETAATAIFRLNEGRFAFVNPVMEEVTGYTCEELTQMSRLELIHPAYREKAQNYISNIAVGALNAPTEFRIIRKDLETTWVSERLTVIASKDREQILGNWMDITEWKIAEEVSRYHSRQTELLLKVGSTVGQTLNLRDIIENFLDSISQMLEGRPVAEPCFRAWYCLSQLN